MKKFARISIAVVFACASSIGYAKKPHPPQEAGYAVPEVTCGCEFVVVEVEEIVDDVPVIVEKEGVSCEVSWDDTAPAYGVDVELEYAWMEGDLEMEGSMDLDLDDVWACESGLCSASGTSLVPDAITGEYSVTAVGKVKGFNNAGAKPRDFVKTTAMCTFPE